MPLRAVSAAFAAAAVGGCDFPAVFSPPPPLPPPPQPSAPPAGSGNTILDYSLCTELGDLSSQLLWPNLPPAPAEPLVLRMPTPAAALLVSSLAASSSLPAVSAAVRCELCGKAFRHRYNLQKHHRVRHTRAGQDRPFECLSCGKLFKTRQHLRNHRSAVHQARPPQQPPHQPSVASPSTPPPPPPHQCRLCRRRFRLERQLRQHELQHGDRRPHRCRGCSATFATQAGLAQHAAAHCRDGGGDVQCFACGRLLPDGGLAALRRHLAGAHCSSLAGGCLACGVDFASRDELQAHMLTRHAGALTLSIGRGASAVRLLWCRICRASPATATAVFQSEAALAAHLLQPDLHCAGRAWLCGLCPRRFGDHRDCRRHLGEHLDGRRRVHVCPSGCRRLFASRTAVARHLALPGGCCGPDRVLPQPLPPLPSPPPVSEDELCQLCPLDVASTIVVVSADGSAS